MGRERLPAGAVAAWPERLREPKLTNLTRKKVLDSVTLIWHIIPMLKKCS
jgi:hypothetical protein